MGAGRFSWSETLLSCRTREWKYTLQSLLLNLRRLRRNPSNRMKLLTKTREIFLDGKYGIYEVYSASVLLLSSLIILNPFTDVFSNGKSYLILSHITSEAQFGSILLFCGLCSLLSLYLDNKSMRIWFSLIQAIIWASLFALMVSASYSSWLPILFVMNSIFSAIVFARLLTT